MGNLAKLLQEKMQTTRPWGMKVSHECQLLSQDLERTLGFSPRVDLLLEREDESRRYWIEFEISRADPVANHTKFATSCLFQPFSTDEIFVSMTSRHVARGRSNLGASTIALLRHLGIKAFQTTLLPQFSGDEIKKLNHLPLPEIRETELDLASELNRIFTVTESLGQVNGTKIHFAANPFEVYLNLRNWNMDIASQNGQKTWKKRTIQYFVFNPWTKQFAPAKFCAYSVIPETTGRSYHSDSYLQTFSMTIPVYAEIDQKNRIFDGQKARRHLEKNLTFALVDGREDRKLSADFDKWIKPFENILNVSKNGPRFLVETFKNRPIKNKVS